MDFIHELFQEAEFNKSDMVSSSPAEETTSDPSSSSVEAAVSTSTPEDQTSDQPADTQSEAPRSSSPIDLSTKKSQEPEPNTETSAATTATTTSQGIDHFLFFTAELRLLTVYLMFVGQCWYFRVGIHPFCSKVLANFMIVYHHLQESTS